MSTDRFDESRSGLSAILNQLPEQELCDIARARGFVPRTTDHAQLAADLEALLADHTSIARSVVSMSPVLREALRAAFVAEDGGGVTPSGMALAMTSMRPASEPEVKPVEAAGFLSDLARLGLLLTWRDSLHQVPQYWLPWEVQHLVPPLLGWCPADLEPPPSTLCLRGVSDARAILAAVWQHVAAQRPRLKPALPVLAERRLAAGLQGWPVEQTELDRLRQARGRKLDLAQQLLTAPPAAFLLSESAMQDLAEAVSISADQAELFCQLLLELALAESVGGRLVAIPDAWETFKSQPESRQLRTMAQAYQSLARWSELDAVLRQSSDLVLWHNGQYTCSYQHFRSRLVRMRHMLLRFLACAGETGWLRLEYVDRALQRLWPEVSALLDAQPASWGVSMRDSSRQFAPHVAPPWDQVQGKVLRFLIQGPLYWLGWVELALDGEQLVAFRPRGLADWVWDRRQAEPTPEGEPVAVERSSDKVTIVVHPDGVPACAHALLGRIAELELARPGHFVYRLDPRRTSAEFEAGRTAADLLDEWSTCLQSPPPQAVADSLHDWWSRYGRVRLYEGFALLELQDDMLLAELEASTSLAQHILARISPRLALVPEEQVPVLLKEFSERGHMPRVLE